VRLRVTVIQEGRDATIREIDTDSSNSARSANTPLGDTISTRQSALKSPGIRPFLQTAVHLGLAPEAQNLSLTPGILRGCSLRSFGTRLDLLLFFSCIGDNGQL